MKSILYKNLKIYFRENTVDENILLHSFNKDIFFIPEFIAGDSDTIVDVGAHIGTFSIYAAYRYPGTKIYAIEAAHDTFKLLEMNVKENNLQNILCFHLAISNQSGQTTLYHNLKDGNWGHTITKNISESTEFVNSETLENFFHKNNIIRCQYMRLNCEGAEYRIIINTPQHILSCVDLMLILYHGDLESQYTTKQLIHHLKTCGFNISTRFTNKRDRGWIIAKGPNYHAPALKSLAIKFKIFVTNISFYCQKVMRKFFKLKDNKSALQ